ncbi:MAG: CoA transferase [Alphaproteobacteria bacterium]|nr:CoA transferase [Alphaproteobacteria bacterium]
MPSALAGLRVIDFTSHLSGPFCAQILADQGAEVIKVERKGVGDDARKMPPHVNGEGGVFMQLNRNKRSFAVDLKSPKEVANVLKLLDGADVLVENFRPGTMERLGLGWKQLSARNPRLIYCSISGFGQTGPYSDRGGFDLMAQAMSGLMSVCGPADGPPHRLPVPITDLCGGMFAAIGVLTALAARERTGRGQLVDTSLYEAGLAFAVYEAAGYFHSGQPPKRLGQAHRGSAPYQVFETKDGWVTCGAATQAMWERLCDILSAPQLKADPRFVEVPLRVVNHVALADALAPYFRQRKTAEWEKALLDEGIPVGPVRTYDQVLENEHTLARKMVLPIEHPKAGKSRILGIPIKLSATPGAIRRPAPVLGEHTDEILAELAAAAPKRLGPQAPSAKGKEALVPTRPKAAGGKTAPKRGAKQARPAVGSKSKRAPGRKPAPKATAKPAAKRAKPAAAGPRKGRG